MALMKMPTYAGGGGTKTLLWSNSDPNNGFNAQTLTLNNLSNYNAILIKTKFYSGRDGTLYDETGWSRIELRNVWQIGCACSSTSGDNYVGFRSVLAYGTSIEFSLGKIMKADFSHVTESPNSIYAVPLEIYGCDEV